MLSESLRGVIAQTLCRKVGGGRIAALEVLLTNGAISNLIREGKTFQIPSMMQVGRAQGMIALNDALNDLVKKGLITADEALLARGRQELDEHAAQEVNGFQAHAAMAAPARRADRGWPVRAPTACRLRRPEIRQPVPPRDGQEHVPRRLVVVVGERPQRHDPDRRRRVGAEPVEQRVRRVGGGHRQCTADLLTIAACSAAPRQCGRR